VKRVGWGSEGERQQGHVKEKKRKGVEWSGEKMGRIVAIWEKVVSWR